jgi:hypothetical protein
MVISFRTELIDYARLLEGVGRFDCACNEMAFNNSFHGYFFCFQVKEQRFLRNLDAGDKLTESEKNSIIARKIGFVMPEVYKEDVVPKATS